MSLLMQALRKAERARTQNGHEAEAEAGQEQPQFGQDAVPSAPPMEGGPAFAVMPDAWQLEPLDAEPPVIPAREAAHDPVPPQAKHEPQRPIRTGGVSRAIGGGIDDIGDFGGSIGAGGPSIAEAGRTASRAAQGPGLGTAPPDLVRDGPAPSNPIGGAPGLGASTAGTARTEPGVRNIGARPVGVPRAIASSQRRLIVLASTLAAMLAVFAFIYWRAVAGPGPGARLPMVPMPAPGSPQTVQPGAVQGAAIPVTPYVTPSADVTAHADPGAAGGGGAVPGSATGGAGAMAASPTAGGGAATGNGTAAANGGGAAAGGGAIAGGGAAAGGGGAMAGGVGSAALAAAGAAAAGAHDQQAAAPTRPHTDVTIPTPEQLAAISDPAIRAEAMRDAAEREARQARTEGLPPAGTSPAPPSSTASVAGAPEISINRQPRHASAAPTAPDAAPAGAPRAATSTPQHRRSGGQPARATAAHGGDTLKTAVGENGEVQFVRGAAPAHIAPAVQNGYAALRQGDLATARQQYDLALLQDPNNRDALLGSAAVALRLHDNRQAASSYQRLLELDPNDPEALAGLTELHPGDLQNNEVKLKGLARQHPDSGPVQFALGNLLARQGRWPEAQQSYFRAYSAMPDNADYAYNLGVGLDRMNQPRLAQTYYRRALELAQASPPTFNVDAVRKRLQALETPPQ